MVSGRKKYVWEKIYGNCKKYFIIDGQGKVRKIFEKVKVDEHNQEVMEALKEL